MMGIVSFIRYQYIVVLVESREGVAASVLAWAQGMVAEVAPPPPCRQICGEWPSVHPCARGAKSTSSSFVFYQYCSLGVVFQVPNVIRNTHGIVTSIQAQANLPSCNIDWSLASPPPLCAKRHDLCKSMVAHSYSINIFGQLP